MNRKEPLARKRLLPWLGAIAALAIIAILVLYAVNIWTAEYPGIERGLGAFVFDFGAIFGASSARAAKTFQCNDHVDNDGDGLCDFGWRKAYCTDGSTPGDSDCTSKNDNDETGACIPACYTNQECGTSGYVGQPYCTAGNAYRDYITHTCENAGTCSALCNQQTNSYLWENCLGNGCTNGQCNPETVCPNGTCEIGEDCTNCPQDCGACPSVCPNGTCEIGEDCSNCPQDCGACPSVCPNGTCEIGEDCNNCPQDCGTCPTECGNETCEHGEDCRSCSEDCGFCTTESILASSVIPIHTGDGTVLLDDHIYITSRFGIDIEGWVAKVNTSDYSYSLSENIGDSDSIVFADGILWIATIQGPGRLYSLNPFSMEADFLVEMSTKITAMVTDGSNIYLGGYRGKFGRYDITSGQMEEVQFPDLVQGVFDYIHTLAMDNDFVYGHVNLESSSIVFKIDKNTLELIDSAEIPDKRHDDILQDDQYFYINSWNLVRISKADLSYSYAFEPASRNIDGTALVDGYILAAKSSDYDNMQLIVIDQTSFTESYRVILTGFNPITKFYGGSNELIVDGEYLHVTRYSSGGGITVTKFKLADILGEAETLTTILFDDFETDFVAPGWYDDGIVEKWKRDNFGTPSGNTGPCSGSSSCEYPAGAEDTDYYIYVETSGVDCYSAGETAIVYQTPAINFNDYTEEYITWWNSMNGVNIGTLKLEENTTGSWVELWSISGNQGADWFESSVDLSGLTGTGNLRFHYTCAGGFWGDAAIDEIGIYGF